MGNDEYKLKLVNPTAQRLEHLVTQMKWRFVFLLCFILRFTSRLCISSTINTEKELLSTGNRADKEWASFWQIRLIIK